jgi:hypothetical protein
LPAHADEKKKKPAAEGNWRATTNLRQKTRAAAVDGRKYEKKREMVWSEEVSYPLRPRREKEDTSGYSQDPNVFSHSKNTVSLGFFSNDKRLAVKRHGISFVITRRAICARSVTQSDAAGDFCLATIGAAS